MSEEHTTEDESLVEDMEPQNIEREEVVGEEPPPIVAVDQELVSGDELAVEVEVEEDVIDENLWKARTGLTEDTLSAALETIIFMSDKPVGLGKMKNIIDPDIPLRIVHQSLAGLQEEYEQKRHGIRLVEVAEGYQFRTKPSYSSFIQNLFKVNQLVLSPSSLEVLAIIAYKQPLAKSEVEKIRGVDSSHLVRGLMDKRLVRVCGRSEGLGRPVLYGTTNEFLEVFNLARIEDLPPEHELKDMIEEKIKKPSDIKGIVSTGEKGAFFFDEMDELEELASKIKSIASDTSFTKSLKSGEKSEEKSVTAFDILEQHVSLEKVSLQNKESGLSETYAAVSLPSVIADLLGGPFNEPEVLEEDDFEMIDLDTGEALFPEEATEIESLQDIQDEAKSLADALDQAFDKLQGSGENSEQIEEEDIEKFEGSIDQIAEDAVENAKNLDIDLDFLSPNQDKDEYENGTNDPSND